MPGKMSRSRYTPGPWKLGKRVGTIEGSFDTRTWGVEQNGGEVALAYSLENAILIAAAPEIFDALKELVGEVVEHNREGRSCVSVTRATAAIAKAEGGRS